MPRAFIVYSSSRHVSYMNEVLNIIESVLDSLGMRIIYLGDGYSGIRYYPEMLQQNIAESDFGIVILDGLRPNVTYELGLLQMSKIDVIPLIKNDAKISVKSTYYNLNKKCNDPELAFGEYRYRKSAFDSLIEPNVIIQEHFSDCQGMHQVRYVTIDDTQENGSLGKVLREEITKIIPHLRSRAGPGFEQIHLMFPDIEPMILDESIILLSLFSVLGWNQSYEGDTMFQSIRKDFLSLFINQPISEDKINSIFNTLLESSENILKNYGKYLTIDSENLIRQSFEYLMQNKDIFNKYYVQIMISTQTELKKRFIERIRSSDVLSAENIEAIANYIFDRSKLFTDISTIQDKEKCQFFVTSASIYPSKALDLLYDWISPLTPMQFAELFPFESTLFSPRNPHDDVLWFLNNISKRDTFFTQSMEILFKFTLSIIVNEQLIQTQIYPYINKLALDRFLEQCHSLEGKVNIITRWNFIRDLSWSENWSEDYIKATKDLKFRVIQTFLQSSWTIPGPVRAGNIEIKRYSVPDGMKYDALETCRTEAYQIIMEWLEQKNEYEHIYNELFDYFYHNLSEWVKYIHWNEIKSLYERIFNKDSQKVLMFLKYVDELRLYDTWQQRYSDENLNKIFQFYQELKDSLSINDYFRRKLGLSEYDTRVSAIYPEEDERQNFIYQLHSTLMEKFNSLTNSKCNEIIKLLISENFSQSFNFGVFFAEHLSIEKLKNFIVSSTELIGTIGKSYISNFYIGLWSGLFRINEQEWEDLLNENWNNTNIQSYLRGILWSVGNRINNTIWIKYLDLLNARLIEPTEIIYLLHKELPSNISEEEIQNTLIKCIEYIGESIQIEKQYPIEEYIRLIWSLEHIFQEKEYLLDNVFAASFLEKFYPISKEILSQLHDPSPIIKCGQLAPEPFKNWLEKGFQLSEFEGNHFLIKCTEDFIEQIFQITEKLFSLPQDVDILTEDHHISHLFEIRGDAGILLKFSEEQITTLYKLNSPKLGYLFGRLIKNVPIEDIFPPVLKRLIISHNKDMDFKNRIFQAFSSGVRSFVGNNYDQQFAGDYARITQWRESETDSIFREWLRELHQYIDSLRDQNRDFWGEREVE
ncbi:MAG: hypothetical protein ACFFD2_16605 [Promethearchaeota archaeon]